MVDLDFSFVILNNRISVALTRAHVEVVHRKIKLIYQHLINLGVHFKLALAHIYLLRFFLLVKACFSLNANNYKPSEGVTMHRNWSDLVALFRLVITHELNFTQTIYQIHSCYSSIESLVARFFFVLTSSYSLEMLGSNSNKSLVFLVCCEDFIGISSVVFEVGAH